RLTRLRAQAVSQRGRAMWSWGVRMPERATGGDAVADELFDLFEFRKAALLLPRPDDLVINAHLKDATGPIRGERHGGKLSANVVNSSCAIQPARRPQPHSLQ